MNRIFLAALTATFLAANANAAPGDFDTTFGGGDGRVNTRIGLSSDTANSVIQQADGKLVVAGGSHNGSNKDFALVRYNSDGSLDTSFDGDGKLTTAIGTSDDEANSVIQQADGKLVVAGDSYNGSDYDVALVRYNSNGSLDTSFDGDGKLITAVGTSFDLAKSVIQQADGKLVVAGSSDNGSDNDFALVRYNSNGSLDNTFNGTGKLITDIDVSDSAYSVIQQADGKLVAAGVSGGGAGAFAVARYNSNGSLDTTFNGTGKLTTELDIDGSSVQSVIQQADGKLVAAGVSYFGINADWALVRYNSNGSLDTTFNGSGKVTMAIGTGNDLFNSVIQQTDGKLVAAGYSDNGNLDFALLRFNNDGSLDTTFNGTGKLIAAIGTSDDYASSVIQQADGKLVAAGYSILFADGSRNCGGAFCEWPARCGYGRHY